MKNSQNGFVIPILIAIVALLAVSSGVYIYTNNKAEAPTNASDITNNEPTTTLSNLLQNKEMQLDELMNLHHFTITIPDDYTEVNDEYGHYFKDSSKAIIYNEYGNPSYYPPEFRVFVLETKKINFEEKLSGSTFFYDETTNKCKRIYSDSKRVEEQSFSINGYNYCQKNFGDGSMHSVTYYLIEPNNNYAVVLSSNGDFDQEIAPISEILKSIKFTD